MCIFRKFPYCPTEETESLGGGGLRGVKGGGGGGGVFPKSRYVVGSWFENLLQVINDQPLKLCSAIHQINHYLVKEY